MSATYRASRRGQMLSMRSAVSRHCFPLKKSEAPAARQGALDCPNDTGSMTQVVLQEDRLQIGARCVGMNPVRFGHNSCSRHRGGTPASAAELTTRMDSRQRVAHHRLRVAIRQRSEAPTLRAKSIASPVGPCILRCGPAGFSSRRHESASSRLRSWGNSRVLPWHTDAAGFGDVLTNKYAGAYPAAP